VQAVGRKSGHPPSPNIKLLLNSLDHTGTGTAMHQDDATSEFTWTLCFDLGELLLKHLTVTICICCNIKWSEVWEHSSISLWSLWMDSPPGMPSLCYDLMSSVLTTCPVIDTVPHKSLPERLLHQTYSCTIYTAAAVPQRDVHSTHLIYSHQCPKSPKVSPPFRFPTNILWHVLQLSYIW
jgi:hypothetical protein